jgi:hypothetical protein
VTRRGRRVAALVVVAGASLLAETLGGCEVLLDTGKLSESNAAGDATTGDGSSSGSSSGGTDGATDATTDHSGGDASDAPSGPEVGPGDAGPCTGPTYYVSATSGNDSNAGCSPTEARKTIAGGIAAAKSYTASPPTIEVCAGSYAESNLTLGYAASLLGGYDCSTWGTDGGGAGSTTITNASPATQAATLVMFGSAVKLDGFTIDGAASVTTDGGTSTYSYAALHITGPGSPTISNNTLNGGSGVGGQPASAGIIVDGPSPVITSNVISGGSGVGMSNSSVPASVGVYLVNGAAPLIRGNTIDGGSGTGVLPAANCSGSAGIVAYSSAGNLTLDGNTISGGSGLVSATTSTGYGSEALWVWGGNGSTYVITNNVLLGGTGSVVTNSTTNAFAIRAVYVGYSASVLFAGNTVDGGVVSSGGQCPQAVDIADAASDTGSVTVSGNRIHAGHCTAFATNLIGNANAIGLRLSGPFTTLTVENNMIDSGLVDVHRYGAAIALANTVTGAQIRHNTLVAGTSTSYAFGIWLQGSLTTATTMENNIFAAIGPNAAAINGDGLGVCAPDGGAPAISSFQNNLLFGGLSALVRYNCGSTPIATTLDTMNAGLEASGATVAGNLAIASSCAASDGGTEVGCIPMSCAADGGTCLDTVFAGWDDATSGSANLFSDAGFAGGCPAVAPPVVGGVGNGWALAASTATPPCAVARSGLNDVDAGEAGVTVDLYGNCRGAHPSMGAAEYPPGATCF